MILNKDCLKNYKLNNQKINIINVDYKTFKDPKKNIIYTKKNITNIFSIDYENDGLILGIAYMKSLEPDWISILENNSFKDYHRDRIRLFFELKGLGSIGRPKDNYLKRRSL